MRLYVNGTQVASRTQTGAMPTTGGPLRIGGNAIWAEWFNGVIDEVRVHNTALTAAEIQTEMNAPVVPAGPDTVAPTVSVSAPAANATVSGTVTVTAAASDNVGVVGVQFYLNGAPLGTEDTAAPFSASWNTTGVADGPHALTAVARDAAGNATTSTAVVVTVNNADATAPSVSVSAPAANATVSGAVTVSATASDNVGVVGVQFLLDGNPLGAEDTTAPYSVSWDTTTATNGSHLPEQKRFRTFARDICRASISRNSVLALRFPVLFVVNRRRDVTPI